MSKKVSKGGGQEFFLPRTPSSRSRGGDAIEEQVGFSRGETAILEALEKVSGRLAKVESKLEDLNTRLKKVEVNTADLDQKIAAITPQLATLQEARVGFEDFKNKAIQSFGQMDAFREKCENEKRSDTIRILGYHNAHSDTELEADISEFLTQQVDPYGDKTSVQISRAYHLPVKKGLRGDQQGGTVIVTLRDRMLREKVLAKAAANKNLTSGDGKVLIFPDVGPLTLGKRRELLEVRKKFIDFGAQASLWAPARLRVRHLNRQYSFTDPSAARELLESLSGKEN